MRGVRRFYGKGRNINNVLTKKILSAIPFITKKILSALYRGISKFSAIYFFTICYFDIFILYFYIISILGPVYHPMLNDKMLKLEKEINCLLPTFEFLFQGCSMIMLSSVQMKNCTFSVGRGQVRRADHSVEVARLREEEFVLDQLAGCGRCQRRLEEVTSQGNSSRGRSRRSGKWVSIVTTDVTVHSTRSFRIG